MYLYLISSFDVNKNIALILNLLSVFDKIEYKYGFDLDIKQIFFSYDNIFERKMIPIL